MVPYCICFFDGIVSSKFYLSDYAGNVDDMLLACIDTLVRPKYYGYKVYIHNLSHFDSIFFNRILAKYTNEYPNLTMSIVKRDTSIISLKITIKIISKNDKIRNESIEFRD